MAVCLESMKVDSFSNMQIHKNWTQLGNSLEHCRIHSDEPKQERYCLYVVVYPTVVD